MTAALILAAAAVTEDGKLKPTDDIGGASSLKRIITIFRQAGIAKVAVVTGFEAEKTEHHCRQLGAVFVRSADYENGDMLSSVKVGLEYLKDKCDRTFIVPADVPLFSLETVKSMEAESEPVVIPMCYNKTGHPLLLSQSVFDRVLEYDGSGGVGGALSNAGIERRFLDVPDEGILLDTGDNTGISSAADNHGLRETRPEAKIKLVREKDFFGPGTFLLLTLVKETGTLKHAALRMGLSHGKAIQMIALAEQQLGFKVLKTGRGGASKGSSVVTREAAELMERYEAFESECTEFVKAAFKRHFDS